jgi:hypothetical protein
LKGVWGKEGAGYEVRFGENWEAELIKNVNKEYCCITELMNFMVEESKKFYEGTDMEDNFFIFHDGLKAWWEKEAQEHLDNLGFRDRQFRCLHPTNADLPAYREKVAGDSPELMRGLDSHGFSDFIRCIEQHTALTVDYLDDDPRKFKIGTPNEVWNTMERCWSIEPRSSRIVEDILGLPRVLDKIIENSGCVVPDEGFRNGVRAKSHDGKKILKRKPLARQRISTQKQFIIHF